MTVALGEGYKRKCSFLGVKGEKGGKAGLYISIFPAQNNARSNIPDNILDIILVSIRQNIQY